MLSTHNSALQGVVEFTYDHGLASAVSLLFKQIDWTTFVFIRT